MFNRYHVTASNAGHMTAYRVACGSYFEEAYEKLTKKIYNLTRVSNKKRWRWARIRADQEHQKQQAATALDLWHYKKKYSVHVDARDSSFNYNFYYITHALSNSCIIKKIDQLIKMGEVDPSIAASYKTRLLMYQIRKFDQQQTDIEKFFLQRDEENREKKAASREKMAKLLLNVFSKIHKVDSSSASILYKNLYLFAYVFQKKSAEEIAGFFTIASNRAEQFKNKINYMIAIKNKESRPVYRRVLPVVLAPPEEKPDLFSWFWGKIFAAVYWVGVQLRLLPEPQPCPPAEKIVPEQMIEPEPEEKEIEEPPLFLHDSPEDKEIKDDEYKSDNEMPPVKRKVRPPVKNGNAMIIKLLETCEQQQQVIKALEEKLTTIKQIGTQKETAGSQVTLKIETKQDDDVESLVEFKDERRRQRRDRRMTLPREVHQTDSGVRWAPIKVIEARTSPNEADLRRANPGCAS